MAKILDIADIFCFIPTYEGSRFLEGGYQLRSEQVEEIARGRLGQREWLIPLALPDSVLNDLPPIPFQASGKLRVQAGVLALLSDLRVFAEREERVRTLEGSSTHFEHELYRRHTEKLREVEKGIGSSALTLKELLTSEFLAQQQTSSYRVIKDFLQSIEEACQGNAVQALLEPSTSDASNIVSALELLQCSQE